MKNISLIVLVALLSFGVPVFAQEDAEKSPKEKRTFAEWLSFEDGTFFGNLNASVIKLANNVEAFREGQRARFEASLDKVDDRRQADDEAKPATKIFTFLHILLLAILLFIFSLQAVFYIAAFLIAIAVIRKLVSVLFGWIRRRE